MYQHYNGHYLEEGKNKDRQAQLSEREIMNSIDSVIEQWLLYSIAMRKL